jgi:hypothetical protein
LHVLRLFEEEPDDRQSMGIPECLEKRVHASSLVLRLRSHKRRRGEPARRRAQIDPLETGVIGSLGAR